MANARPSIASEEKLRLSSLLCPRAASWASSAAWLGRRSMMPLFTSIPGNNEEEMKRRGVEIGLAFESHDDH